MVYDPLLRSVFKPYTYFGDIDKILPFFEDVSAHWYMGEIFILGECVAEFLGLAKNTKIIRVGVTSGCAMNIIRDIEFTGRCNRKHYFFSHTPFYSEESCDICYPDDEILNEKKIVIEFRSFILRTNSPLFHQGSDLEMMLRVLDSYVHGVQMAAIFWEVKSGTQIISQLPYKGFYKKSFLKSRVECRGSTEGGSYSVFAPVFELGDGLVSDKFYPPLLQSICITKILTCLFKVGYYI